jgi:NAD(P) transhydrogenase
VAERYDLVVIGCGPAGESGAILAAVLDKRVAVVERAPYVGGAAVNTGTIPSKTLRESALYFSGLRQRGLYGVDYSFRKHLTIREFMHREQVVVQSERTALRALLDRHGVELIHGEGSLVGPHSVRVRGAAGERALEAEVILIATGSSPYHPPGIPFEHLLVHDSDTMLTEVERIPSNMVVVGGGVIGCEYASIFAALSVQVTLLERKERLLPFVDGEIVARLQAQLEQIGVRFRFNTAVHATRPEAERVHLDLEGGETLHADLVLFCAGRQSNVTGLGLETVGVKQGERGLILVDEHCQTNVPGIYAAGDVIGFPALANTSAAQGRRAVAHAFSFPLDDKPVAVLPMAVYTIPEVAMAGLTEAECRAKSLDYMVGRAYYDQIPRGIIIGDKSGMLKLIFAAKERTLLGVHHIGELSSELVHIGAEILQEGGSIDAFINTVYNDPSLSDLYQAAAYDGVFAMLEGEGG